MGTEGCGMLGMLSRPSVLSWSSTTSSLSISAILLETSLISAMRASFSSPLGILEISMETSFLFFLRRLPSSVSALHFPSASRNWSSHFSSLRLFLIISLIMSGFSLMMFASSMPMPQNFFCESDVHVLLSVMTMTPPRTSTTTPLTAAAMASATSFVSESALSSTLILMSLFFLSWSAISS